MASVERMTGVGILDIVGGRPSLTQTALIITAGAEGYSRRHPGAQKALNPKLALRLIAGAGGYSDVVAIVLESLVKAEGLDIYDFTDEEAAAPADDAGADDGGDPFVAD